MIFDAEINNVVEDIVTEVLQCENDSSEKVEPIPSQESDFSPIEDLSQMIFDAELKIIIENIVTEVLRRENDSTNISESVDRMSTGHMSDNFDTEFDEVVSGMTFEAPDIGEDDSFGSDGTFEKIVSEIPNEELIPPITTDPNQEMMETVSSDSSELLSLSQILEEINKD